MVSKVSTTTMPKIVDPSITRTNTGRNLHTDTSGAISSILVGTTTPITLATTTYRFRSNISFNQPEGNDKLAVVQLQQLLNTLEGEHLLIDGQYGIEDVAAIKRFQLKYRSEILSVWGLTEATG